MQSDKLSSPVGSLVEGLNKEPSSETIFSIGISSASAADCQGVAEGNAVSQFRSPLLRQMMGNKLAAGYRPTSASSDSVASTVSSTVSLVSGDGATSAEIVAETVANSTSQSNQPSSVTSSSTKSVDDEIAVCDEPLDPSPRVQAPAAHTNQGWDETSAESMLKPLPIEVWTEESTVGSSSCPAYDDRGTQNDRDELCIEDDPLVPSPRPEVDSCISDKPQKLSVNSQPDPSSNRSNYSGIDDKDELCVEDLPLEPSPHLEGDVLISGKLEERTSVIDEDRDIDTTETSVSEAKPDLLMDASKWNGVEQLNVSDPPSTLLNGYSEDDMRM